MKPRHMTNIIATQTLCDRWRQGVAPNFNFCIAGTKCFCERAAQSIQRVLNQEKHHAEAKDQNPTTDEASLHPRHASTRRDALRPEAPAKVGLRNRSLQSGEGKALSLLEALQRAAIYGHDKG